jgi:phosphohistidine phosphatase
MHQLLLLRHAKSSWDDPKLPDRERPLNPRGQIAATAVRQAMRDIGLAPDVVLVSPARRTMQTLAALEPWDDTPLVEHVEALYLASADDLLTVLRGVATMARSVLVIGHNPGLHELAMLLVGSAAMTPAHSDMRHLAEGLPTGGLIEFAIAGPWATLGEGAGRLQRFVVPRDLAAGAAPG